MPPAIGEKIVTLVPRSRWSLSCCWTLARISSSLKFSIAFDGAFDGSFTAASCRSRKSRIPFGTVV